MGGQRENDLVVGSTEKRFIQKKQPGSKAWTSFIECISPAGWALHPLVISKGKSVQQQWFPMGLKAYKGWKFTATDNGWTSNDTALEYGNRTDHIVEILDPENCYLRQAVSLAHHRVPLSAEGLKTIYTVH